MVELGDLKASDRVLDIGCGPGRLAVPLTRYLDDAGSYDGLDIIPESIDWCRENISKRDERFRFHLADIRNSAYNESGADSCVELSFFPSTDETFDFVFLASVFTHMLPEGVEHYLSEIARVLKPGGTLFDHLLPRETRSRSL